MRRVLILFVAIVCASCGGKSPAAPSGGAPGDPISPGPPRRVLEPQVADELPDHAKREDAEGGSAGGTEGQRWTASLGPGASPEPSPSEWRGSGAALEAAR